MHIKKTMKEKRKTKRITKRFYVTIDGNHYQGLDISNVGLSFYVPDKGDLLFPKGHTLSVTINYCHQNSIMRYVIAQCAVANMTHTQEGKSSVFGLSIKHIDDETCIKHFHFVSGISPDHYCSTIELEAPVTVQQHTPPFMNTIQFSAKSAAVEPYRIKEMILILKTLEKDAVNEYISNDEFRAEALVEIQEMLALLGQS